MKERENAANWPQQEADPSRASGCTPPTPRLPQGTGRSKKQTRARASGCAPSTPRLPPVTPRRSQVRFSLRTHLLKPCAQYLALNYDLPPLVELEADDSGLESLASESAASSDWNYRPRTSTTYPAPPEATHQRPNTESPLPRSRRLRSHK